MVVSQNIDNRCYLRRLMIKTVSKAKTKCSSCNSEVSVKQALDCAQKAWPERGWFLYLCPYCNEGNHMEVHDDLVIEGHLDGFPAPMFVKSASRSPYRFWRWARGNWCNWSNWSWSWSSNWHDLEVSVAIFIFIKMNYNNASPPWKRMPKINKSEWEKI